jgi:hypothetical protein
MIPPSVRSVAAYLAQVRELRSEQLLPAATVPLSARQSAV